jgi:hypothetical protein
MHLTVSLAALGAIAFGLLQCFFGYRMFRVILGITGFILGGLLAGLLVYNLTDSQLFGVIAGVIGGLIGAGLMAGLYIVGVFVIGALFGGLAASLLLPLGGGSPPAWLVVLLAILVGVLAMIFQKLMIVIATSFGGAWWAISGIAAMTGAIEMASLRGFPLELQNAGTGWLVAWLVLAIVGLIVQYSRRPSH